MTRTMSRPVPAPMPPNPPYPFITAAPHFGHQISFRLPQPSGGGANAVHQGRHCVTPHFSRRDAPPMGPTGPIPRAKGHQCRHETYCMPGADGRWPGSRPPCESGRERGVRTEWQRRDCRRQGWKSSGSLQVWLRRGSACRRTLLDRNNSTDDRSSGPERCPYEGALGHAAALIQRQRQRKRKRGAPWERLAIHRLGVGKHEHEN